MCEPKKSYTGLMVGSAALAGCLLAVGAYAKAAPVKTVAIPKPAPVVVHAGLPWWVWVVCGLAVVVLAVAAIVAVVWGLRRRRAVRVVAPTQVRRALARGPQRELTTSAAAWMRVNEKTEVKR